jgi:hypothetical protein
VRRIGITLSLVGLLLGVLALPGGASASHLSRSDFKSASKYCKALRAELGGKAFKKAFRAKRVRGAHRRCVKKNGSVRALAPVSIFPVPAAECPPGTQPEPPKPVSAFATPVACVPLPPAAAQPAGDEDEEEADDQPQSGDGDDEDDDSDRDDGDSDEEDD